MSEEPKNSAAPPSKEPITKAALEALGLRVLPPRGTGIIIGVGAPRSTDSNRI